MRFSRIARDCKINALEGVKMRHFRAKSHLDTLVVIPISILYCLIKFPIKRCHHLTLQEKGSIPPLEKARLPKRQREQTSSQKKYLRNRSAFPRWPLVSRRRSPPLVVGRLKVCHMYCQKGKSEKNTKNIKVSAKTTLVQRSK